MSSPINYELALELKNAGFPVKKEALPGGQVIWEFPTLSELIEACGPNFVSLDHAPQHKDGDRWIAFAGFEDYEESSPYCSTPEIAVARLWLALNKPH